MRNNMDQILIYGDSLTWGIIPGTRKRLSFEKRWPGILENALHSKGHNIRVIENCLNGRRTAWSDPFLEGRDGSQGLAQVIEMHSPLRLVIVMLGQNDFQCTHNHNALLSAQGTKKLIDIIQQAPIEPGMPKPDILIISPPQIIEPMSTMAVKFKGAAERWSGLSEALASVAQENSTYFFDSNSVTTASIIDGVHLDENQHMILGEAIANKAIDCKLLSINK